MMTYMKSTTIREALKRASLSLKNAGIPRHNYEAGLLLAFCLEKDLVFIYTYPEKLLADEDVKLYQRLVEKRSSGVPFHYLKGEREFMGLDFKVNPGVLIPRPETELVAETALEWARTRTGDGETPITILDLGTGSGVLAVTLACMLPLSSLWATDISGKALETARENAFRHGVKDRITFLQGDLWEPLESPGLTGLSDWQEFQDFSGEHQRELKFSIIVSNPPYIPTDQLEQLSPGVREQEPLLALEGGPDGLDFYRGIFSKLHRFIDLPGITVLEVGAGQCGQVSALAEKSGLFREVRVIKDYSGIERVVAACR